MAVMTVTSAPASVQRRTISATRAGPAPTSGTNCWTRYPMRSAARSVTAPAPSAARRPGSILQRQGDPPAVPRGEVGGDQDLERVKALAPIGVGSRGAAQGLDHVLVIPRVPVAVYRGGLVAGPLDFVVHRVLAIELPVL